MTGGNRRFPRIVFLSQIAYGHDLPVPPCADAQRHARPVSEAPGQRGTADQLPRAAPLRAVFAPSSPPGAQHWSVVSRLQVTFFQGGWDMWAWQLRSLVPAHGLLAGPVRLQGRGEGRKDLRLRLFWRPLLRPRCLRPLGTSRCCSCLPIRQWSQVQEKPMALHTPS